MPIEIPADYTGRTLIHTGLAQTDIDMDFHKLLNLDTSNLPPSGIPPTVHPPANQWLHDWDSAAQTWTATRPDFIHLNGSLTNSQKLAINMVGTIGLGIWQGTIIEGAYLAKLNEIRFPTGPVNIGFQRLINLADPIEPFDAVNKRFMDFLLQGLNVKEAVRVASTSDLSLFGQPAIDGVTVAVGDRVLAKNQSASRAYENGIWVVTASGHWDRAADTPGTELGLERAYCTVSEGTVNGATSWVQVNDLTDPIGIGDVVNFVLFSTFTGGGEPGPPGPPGEDGRGIPEGGIQGQLLMKSSAIDYDSEWYTAPTGVPFASLQTTIVSTPGTASTLGVMAGLGAAAGNEASITPISSNKIQVTISGTIWNNTAAGTAFAKIRHGTGAAPAHGAAATGTIVGGTAIRGAASGSVGLVPFSLTATITGLNLGTAVWLDLQYGVTGGGGTAILTEVAVSAIEIP